VPIIIGLLALVVDLGQPLRFWHLMLQFGPVNSGIIFLPGSVMSIGTWILVVFSVLCGVVYPLMWLAEEKFARNIPVLSSLAGRDGLRRAVGLIGLPFALLIAVYTGVLIATSSRPILADTPFLPILFVVSATSTGFAAIMLAMSLSSAGDHSAINRLERGDNTIIKLELAVVAVFFAVALFMPRALGMLKAYMIGPYAVFFWVGFIAVGLLLPLAIQRYSLSQHKAARGLAIMSSALVLLGGFYLRFIMLLAT